MTIPIKKPSPAMSLIQNSKVTMSKHWQQWFDQMLADLHKALVPPRSIILCHLSAAVIAEEFDANGLGRVGGPYEWWAICNGNTHTVGSTSFTAPDLGNHFIRCKSDTAGKLSDVVGASGKPTYGLVPLIRIDYEL